MAARNLARQLLTLCTVVPPSESADLWFQALQQIGVAEYSKHV